MAEYSPIEWTDASWPIVAGCEFASPECTNCYALLDSWRMAHNPNPKIHRAFFGTVDKTEKGHLVWSGIVRTLPLRLSWPLKWKRARRIFVCNLADLFHPKVPFEFIAAAWCVMMIGRQHTFQVLTKHPERMQAFLTWLDDKTAEVWNKGQDQRSFGEIRVELLLEYARYAMPAEPRLLGKFPAPEWPLPNVHLGVTAGDQKRADERIPILMVTLAAKRFLSYEPAIGAVDLRNLRGGQYDALTGSRKASDGEIFAGAHGLDWVIAGGESGARARAPDPDWFRKVRDDCAEAGVPFHFKQWGVWYPCETDVLPEPPGKVIEVDDDDIAGKMNPNRGYQVIALHGKEFFRAGKKLAGRRLDGRTHDGRLA